MDEGDRRRRALFAFEQRRRGMRWAHIGALLGVGPQRAQQLAARGRVLAEQDRLMAVRSDREREFAAAQRRLPGYPTDRLRRWMLAGYGRWLADELTPREDPPTPFAGLPVVLDDRVPPGTVLVGDADTVERIRAGGWPAGGDVAVDDAETASLVVIRVPDEP